MEPRYGLLHALGCLRLGKLMVLGMVSRTSCIIL